MDDASIRKLPKERQGFLENPGSVRIEADGKKIFQATDLDQRFRDNLGRVTLTFPPVKAHKIRVIFPWMEKTPFNNLKRLGLRLGDVDLLGTVEAFPEKATEGTMTWRVTDVMQGKTLAQGENPIND